MFPNIPLGLFTIPLKLHSAVPLWGHYLACQPSNQYGQKTGARFLRRLRQLSTISIARIGVLYRSGMSDVTKIKCLSGFLGNYRATILTRAE